MAQNNTTIPDKNAGQTLTAAEFNELDDAVNNNATDAEGRFSSLESGNWYFTKMGDETNEATVGEKTSWVTPAPGKIHDVHSAASSIVTVAGLSVDVKNNDTTILSTTGILGTGNNSTNDAGSTDPVLTTSPTSFAQGDEISFHVSSFGGVGGTGLHTDLLISWD